MYHFCKLERKLKRIAKYEQSIELLKKGMDGLIISVKQHPLPWVLMLRKFMKPGRPFSVFCERQGLSSFLNFSNYLYLFKNH